MGLKHQSEELVLLGPMVDPDREAVLRVALCMHGGLRICRTDRCRWGRRYRR